MEDFLFYFICITPTALFVIITIYSLLPQKKKKKKRNSNVPTEAKKTSETKSSPNRKSSSVKAKKKSSEITYNLNVRTNLVKTSDMTDEEYNDAVLDKTVDIIDTALNVRPEDMSDEELYQSINLFDDNEGLGLQDFKNISDSIKKQKNENVNKENLRQSKSNNITTNTMDELNSLIGLDSVKTQIRRMRSVLIKNKNRDCKIGLHMCFYGNPGTGKTIVARLIAKILYESGILPTDKLIETDRSGLCGEYMGQTGPKTHEKVKEAMGGVLFIDEAYTLSNKQEWGNDFGNEAIAALLKDMEDYDGKFCVILAGYKDQMEDMISTNPGFDSRIKRKIIFPDYTLDELLQILDLQLNKNDYTMTKDARKKTTDIIKKLSSSPKFANARTIRNMVDSLIEIQSDRTINDNNRHNDNERIIKIEDVTKFNLENVSE